MEFKVVRIGDAPAGWRMATCGEFEANRNACLRCPGMSDWAICATADGKIDGSGYGGKATRGAGRDGVGEMLIVRGSGGGGGGGGNSYSSGGGHSHSSGGGGSRGTLSDITKIAYLDDIPEGYRLMSCDEFEAHRSECLRFMGQWDILLLTDGKCDGSGYGGKATRLTRQEREKSSSTNERMGEVLIARESGGHDLSSFKNEVLSQYNRYLSNMDDSDLVNSYLTYAGRNNYVPSVLVSSCPGDAHGGCHSRVKAFTEGNGWRFAPVFFRDQQNANDWKRLWKIQVEEFACQLMAAGRSTILEVKIDGGGAGCATERSRNMSQWWIDWVKRLGCDICSDLQRRNTRAAFDVDGCVQIQIGQVVVAEDEFLNFNNTGSSLTPITVSGVGFEQHTLTLHANKRYWVLVTDAYKGNGHGSYSRDGGRHLTASGVF